MLNKSIKFIHSLRLYLLTVIVVGFFVVAGLNPIDVSVFVGAKMGQAVGMSISVPENPFNKLARELNEKEENLNAREKDLNEREEALSDSPDSLLLIGIGLGVVVLFILVSINYYLDFRRRKNSKV
jgi:hypothetical protein